MALPGKPPKRPTSAYFMWLSENRNSVKDSLPDEQRGSGDIARECSRRWGALRPADKERYNEAWKAARERYAQEVVAFTAAGGELPPRTRRSKASRQPQQQGEQQQHQRQPRGAKRKGGRETLEAAAHEELLAEVGRRLRDDASFAELVGGALAAACGSGAGGGGGGGKRARRKTAVAGDAKEGKGDWAAPPTKEERTSRRKQGGGGGSGGGAALPTKERQMGTVVLDEEKGEEDGEDEAEDGEEDAEAVEIPELTGIPTVVHAARRTVAKEELPGFSRWLEAGRYDRFLEECQTNEAAVLCRRATEVWTNLGEEKKKRWVAKATSARS